MIIRLMKLGSRIRPWMVAVAMVSGTASAGCGNGGDDPQPDVAADIDNDADQDVLPDGADDGRTDCTPYAYYGPRTCASDAECEAENGTGWVCDEYRIYDDGCGGTVRWGPLCRPGGTDAGADADAADVEEDVPPVLYGPLPTDADTDADAEDVEEDIPGTFYGPPPADA
ncbi:MAG: hypothetical protein QME96_11920 [Myxococcota bacterium]|nr:hypothetical protein [Myxococcota bacterium]